MDAYMPVDDAANDGPAPFVKYASREQRMGFVRKVYGILTVQLLMTVLIALPFQYIDKQTIFKNTWMLEFSIFITMSTMCIMSCCPNTMRHYPGNYLLLFVFTAGEAVLIGFTTATYSENVVLAAAVCTFMIFGCLTLYAWVTPTDFTGAGPYLFGALMSLCMFGFIMAIMSMFGMNVPYMHKIYAFLTLLLFTFYIVYDTQMMIGGTHKCEFSIDDYVCAALNLYLDIINIFLALLELFGGKDK